MYVRIVSVACWDYRSRLEFVDGLRVLIVKANASCAPIGRFLVRCSPHERRVLLTFSAADELRGYGILLLEGNSAALFELPHETLSFGRLRESSVGGMDVTSRKGHRVIPIIGLTRCISEPARVRAVTNATLFLPLRWTTGGVRPSIPSVMLTGCGSRVLRHALRYLIVGLPCMEWSTE